MHAHFRHQRICITVRSQSLKWLHRFDRWESGRRHFVVHTLSFARHDSQSVDWEARLPVEHMPDDNKVIGMHFPATLNKFDRGRTAGN